jgi:hypothetical protein
MNPEAPDFKRLFTVDEANAMLPLVRAICQDLSALAGEVVERRERVSFLMAGRGDAQRDPYSEELLQIEEELQRDRDRVREYVQELNDLGVQPKDAVAGLVDFPSMIDDRLVYLCWKLGEPEVLYWHDVDAGYSARQPLTAASGATESGLGGQSSGF